MGRRNSTNINGTTPWSGDEKEGQDIVSLTAIFMSDHSVSCVYLLLFYGLVCFVVFSYPVR